MHKKHYIYLILFILIGIAVIFLYYNYLLLKGYSNPILRISIVLIGYILMAFVAYQTKPDIFYPEHRNSKKGREEWNKNLNDFINNSDDDK